jgi:hypothetical protein
MKHTRSHLVALGLLVAAQAAHAQIYAPGPGNLTKHLFSIPGIINNGFATAFECTNATENNVTVGVEVFATAGGPAVNNALLTAATLTPGATVTYVTQDTAAMALEVNLVVGLIHGGSARILADVRSGVLCSAFLVDPYTYPVATTTSLSVVAKTKQKGD